MMLLLEMTFRNFFTKAEIYFLGQFIVQTYELKWLKRELLDLVNIILFKITLWEVFTNLTRYELRNKTYPFLNVKIFYKETFIYMTRFC